MNFLELTGVVGFGLAIGAALDYMVKPDLKLSVANSIQRVGSRSAAVQFGISPYIDRIFGPKLASSRAVLVSTVLSLISLLTAYAFAYFTSETSVVSIFESNPSWRSIWIFAIFVVGCLIGDYFSFAQTRVFLRTVDGSRRGVIAIGLALSDAIISLAIFVGFFSITRLIAYLLIIGTSTQGPIEQTQRLNTGAIAHAVTTAIKDGLVMPDEVQWSAYVGKVNSREDVSKLDEVTRRYTNDLIKENRQKDIVSVNVSMSCVSTPYDSFANLPDAARLIAKEVAGRRGLEVDGKAFNNLYDDILKRLQTWRPTDRRCLAPTLTVKQALTPGGLLNVAGLWNAIAASFERTLFDFYTNFGYKLAPYASVDPEADIGIFYTSLIKQTQYGILGIGYGDPGVRYALGEFSYKAPDKTEMMQVPFSPMLASSLTVSIAFWFYIVLIYVSRLSVLLMSYVHKATSKINIDLAPFTFSFLALGVMTLVASALLWLISGLWSLLFGSFV